MTSRDLEFGWWKDIDSDEGTDVWFLMAESDYLAENYWAKVVDGGAYTWEVGMGFPEGKVLANGESDTLEQAQQQAERAWTRVVNQ
ncbi:hypothetical protein [Amycolatopsis sp. lyj-84]|uniref:hypothetical protein n=1 Tax=Amycolatopsis sp. lyj-84 TaxID=2789284 RepID=UPI00397E8C11